MLKNVGSLHQFLHVPCLLPMVFESPRDVEVHVLTGSAALSKPKGPAV